MLLEIRTLSRPDLTTLLQYLNRSVVATLLRKSVLLTFRQVRLAFVNSLRPKCTCVQVDPLLTRDLKQPPRPLPLSRKAPLRNPLLPVPGLQTTLLRKVNVLLKSALLFLTNPLPMMDRSTAMIRRPLKCRDRARSAVLQRSVTPKLTLPRSGHRPSPALSTPPIKECLAVAPLSKTASNPHRTNMAPHPLEGLTQIAMFRPNPHLTYPMLRKSPHPLTGKITSQPRSPPNQVSSD